MWALLAWLNEKVKKVYLSAKQNYLEQSKRQKLIASYYQKTPDSKRIPEYLLRDMGLPPYDLKNEEKKKNAKGQ